MHVSLNKVFVFEVYQNGTIFVCSSRTSFFLLFLRIFKKISCVAVYSRGSFIFCGCTVFHHVTVSRLIYLLFFH